VKYHLVQESASNDQIAVEFIGTDNQLGDVLTKSLGRVKFQELCDRIVVDLNKLQHKAEEESVSNNPCACVVSWLVCLVKFSLY
jgi:hypothetical protein